MFGTVKSAIAAAALASLVAFAGWAPAGADERGIKNFLTENTLVYPGEEGEENLIHFGRFGNFDWYYPCEFETGSWSLGTDMVLSLTYDNPRRAPKRYKLDRYEDRVALLAPDGDSGTTAMLLEGNRLPFG